MDTNANICQTCLDERFTFLRQAGKGTYGTTWVAVDKLTGKKVAVKAINKTTTSRSNFKKEFKYSKHIAKHPNIITTHDTAYETKSSYILVQDFAAGGDLFDAIEPEVGIHESRARVYLGQIARALESMHGRKLVHRDIKPENIVLGDMDGTYVQLIDFGMTLRSGTHVSKVCGSIPYTPPEICSASDDAGFFVGPACDVWSVGVLLFCMLTGSFPWEQATLSDPNFRDFWQWQTGARRTVPYLWRNFSPELLELFSKLLAVDVRKRCRITEVYHYLNKPWFRQASLLPACPAQQDDALTADLSHMEVLCSLVQSQSIAEDTDFDAFTDIETSSHLSLPWTAPNHHVLSVSAC